MFFNSRQVEEMREKHRQSRSMFYALAAAPLLFYVIAIIGISVDRVQVLVRNLDVVAAKITQDAASSGSSRMDLTYPCQRKSITATVTVAQLAHERSYTKEQILKTFRTGDSLKLGINSDCEIEMLSVGQPPILLYLGITAFMAIVTLAWAGFVYIIWFSQGMILDSYSTSGKGKGPSDAK